MERPNYKKFHTEAGYMHGQERYINNLEQQIKELREGIKEALKYLNKREAIFSDSPIHKNFDKLLNK